MRASEPASRFNRAANRFTRFELVCVGVRVGRTGNNGRGRDVGAKPIGFYLSLAAPGRRVAPTFINMYSVDWVRDPRR